MGDLCAMSTLSISLLSLNTPELVRYFSTPFHAIIMPLSEQSLGGGLTNLNSVSWQTLLRALAIKLLQATPPDTTYF